MPSAKSTKTALAKDLGVSRASLYYRPKKPPEDEALKARIAAVMDEHPAYGHRRVATALGMNRKPVIRVMRAFGMRPRVRRGVRLVKPGDIGRPETLIPNVLKSLCPVRANVVWAGDFTYFWHVDRFWYLATVIDVHTREIVGWHVANHHTTALIIEAFKDAARRTGAAPKWFHSDQGSEYVSGAYESLLASYGTTASQSRKGSPWQNGLQESFYSNFKLELGDVRRFAHVGELVEAVHQQIAYYNDRRIHSALGMPPAAYRERQKQKIAAFAAPARLIYSTGLLVKSV
jgi:transposase InsO family protein